MPIPPPNPPDFYQLSCPACGWRDVHQEQPSALQKLTRRFGGDKIGKKCASLPDGIAKECPSCGAAIEAHRISVHY